MRVVHLVNLHYEVCEMIETEGGLLNLINPSAVLIIDCFGICSSPLISWLKHCLFQCIGISSISTKLT